MPGFRGRRRRVPGSPGLGNLAINTSNDLFATDGHSALSESQTGGAGSVSLFSQSAAADFTGMAFDSGGDLYVGNLNVGLQGITPGGSVSTIGAVAQALDVVTVPEPGVAVLVLRGRSLRASKTEPTNSVAKLIRPRFSSVPASSLRFLAFACLETGPLSKRTLNARYPPFQVGFERRDAARSAKVVVRR